MDQKRLTAAQKQIERLMAAQAAKERRVAGETTLEALQQAYMAATYRAQALRICEQLDHVCDFAAPKAKRWALDEVRKLVTRIR